VPLEPSDRRDVRQILKILKTVLAAAVLTVLWAAAARQVAARPSNMTAPASFARITLPDAAGKTHRIGDYNRGKILVLVFMGAQCPVSNFYIPTLNRLSAAYLADGVRFVGVDIDPLSSGVNLAAHDRAYHVQFPVLRDARLRLASALGAKVTSETFVFDRSGRLRYHGRIDNTYLNRVQRRTITQRRDLRAALSDLLAGRTIREISAPAFGCLITTSGMKAMPMPGMKAMPMPGMKAMPVSHYTYAHDVAPLVYKNCVTCHRPGQVAPFSLLTFADAKRWGHDIVDVTGKRLMPPWKPVDDHNQFEGERHLSDHQIELLSKWVEEGMPAGNLKEAPKPPHFGTGWLLGKPDLVLKMSEAYDVPADGRDIYRCFVLPTGLTKDEYVSAVEYHPGNRKIVHHCLAYVDTHGYGRALDAKDPGPGYTNFGGPGFKPDGEMGGWAPGNDPIFLPPGVARLLPKGSDIILQVHYHKDGKPESDQSQVGLYFAKGPVRQRLRVTMLVQPHLSIPAGDDHYVAETSFVSPVNAHIIWVMPHMHLLGRDIEMDAQMPDGSQRRLVHINNWDFNWQGTYQFKHPVAIPAGTRLTLRAVYDNSVNNPRNPNNPPKEVHWGEQTTDEMCIGFVGYVRDSDAALSPIASR